MVSGRILSNHSVLSHRALAAALLVPALAGWAVAACGDQGDQSNGAAATGGTSDASVETGGTGLESTGGGGSGGQSCTAPVPGARTHPGNFDTDSCNRADCHTGVVGGWLYNNAAGDRWIGEATITITSSDGTVVAGISASDGFFQLNGPITPPYMACASLCPDTTCTITAHLDTDCQNPACHGGTSPRVYLTQAADIPSTGGAGGTGGGGGNCIPPASGGPRTHVASEYDTFGCRMCHMEEGYTGGFLYDGIDSTTPVAQATFTLTAQDGTVLTAVSGPGGMFYFPGLVPAPYTICVSKCPDTVCSGPENHPDDTDCRECHKLEDDPEGQPRLHLP